MFQITIWDNQELLECYERIMYCTKAECEEVMRELLTEYGYILEQLMSEQNKKIVMPKI